MMLDIIKTKIALVADKRPNGKKNPCHKDELNQQQRPQALCNYAGYMSQARRHHHQRNVSHVDNPARPRLEKIPKLNPYHQRQSQQHRMGQNRTLIP